MCEFFIGHQEAEKYQKRNNAVIRRKSGWCSLIWSCIIFLPCHLLYNFLPKALAPHFLFYPKRCYCMEKYLLALWLAPGRSRVEPWKSRSLISSSPLTQVGVLLACSSLKPRGRGLAQFGAQLFPFRLGLPQRLSFRYSRGEIKWNKPSLWKELP